MPRPSHQKYLPLLRLNLSTITDGQWRREFMNRGKEKHQSHEDVEKTRHKHKDKEKEKEEPAPDTLSPTTAVQDKKVLEPAVDQAATITALQDQLLLLRADFDNFRKRTLREKNEIYDAATSDLILEVLPVLDHIQLGIQAAAGHKAIQDGFRLVFDQLLGVLSKCGLVPFDVEKQPFDPDRCEAISCLASDQAPEGMVLVQIRRGYMLRSRLLRPAQVVVSSGPPVDKQPEPNEKQDS